MESLRFVVDENARGSLSNAIQTYNAGEASDLLDVVRVGDLTDLPLGASDTDILIWAEREQRILLSFDRRSLPAHLNTHLASGRECPGIIVLPATRSFASIVQMLVLIALGGLEHEYANQIVYVKQVW